MISSVERSQEPAKIKTLTVWIILFGCTATLLCLIGLGFFIHGVYVLNTSCSFKLNEFGDYVGGVSGGLWSLAGVMIVAIAFFAQQVQIEYQKIEIAEAREDSKKQYFENTFFSLLNLHHKIISNIDLSGGSSSPTGIDCFEIFFTELRSKYNHTSEDVEELERVREACSEFFRKRNSDLVHYLANVKSIVNFVSSSFYLSDDENGVATEKNKYYAMIEAQISFNESLICTYYASIDEFFKQEYEVIYRMNRLSEDDFIQPNHRGLIYAEE